MANSYTCDLCGVLCSKFSNLKRHAKNRHGVEIPNLMKLSSKENDGTFTSDGVRTLKCGICDIQTTRQKLDSHYIEFHEIDLNIERIEFTSISTFHEWKKAIEKENHCKYVASCGRKYNHERYMCHRSGDFKSKSKGVRSLKKQGSKKIGAYCPSKMIVTKKGNFCSVKFVKTHVGHENELCHVTLTADVRAKIANRLAQNIPPIIVLEEIKNSMRETNARIHLLTLKDLYNISKEFKIDISGDTTMYNEVNLEKLMNSLKSTSVENSVVYYKPYGEADGSCPELQSDDFILIIMNQTQIDLLQRYATNTVILDRTWKISYNLHLMMLLILDETHRAIPCCFFFTNNDDESRLKIIFTILQSKIGVLESNIFMSCTSEHYYKAWTSVMNIPNYHLYCPWSVNQTWIANLGKIKNQDKRNEVTELLKKLSEEPDTATFPALLNEAVQKITRDEETRQYGRYFCKFFLQKVVQWARCYQMQLGLKDTSDLENVCKIVKYVYFNFKKRGDLNDCITFLYTFLRDRLFSKRVTCSNEEVFRQQQCLRENHEISTSKTYSNAVTESGSWVVISSAEKTVHEVRTLTTDCQCEIFCDKCNVCVHHYTCSCVDSSIGWNMCHHIHYICMYLQQSKNEDAFVFDETNTINFNDAENDKLEKYYYSDEDGSIEEEDCYNEEADCYNEEVGCYTENADQGTLDETLDNQSQINAVLEINGLMDEIILNMQNQQASSFVINNLRNMLEVLKSKDVDSLGNIIDSCL